MPQQDFSPLDDAELNEIERCAQEALGYRHQPEFAYECARLVAEVRRLRERESRWSLARLGRMLVPTWNPKAAPEAAAELPRTAVQARPLLRL
jgi:hypothetical protein